MGRPRVRELARKFLDEGNPTGWFDALYAEAAGNADAIPWANLIPNAGLIEWLEINSVNGAGKTALVVGCGLGDDAEALAKRGYDVTAFDISAEAIRWAKQRFPDTKVHYETANLLAPPAEWHHHFDFVFECYTLQSLPPEIRSTAIEKVAECVSGQLLLIARARNNDEPLAGTPPWPLTHDELNQFTAKALQEVSFEDYPDGEDPPVRRFRVLYGRA